MDLPELSPDPGVVLERIYMGLPEHYRTADEPLGFPLYRWLAGLCRVASEVDELKERIDYVVPDDRLEPWVPGDPAVNYVHNPGPGPTTVGWSGSGNATLEVEDGWVKQTYVSSITASLVPPASDIPVALGESVTMQFRYRGPGGSVGQDGGNPPGLVAIIHHLTVADAIVNQSVVELPAVLDSEGVVRMVATSTDPSTAKMRLAQVGYSNGPVPAGTTNYVRDVIFTKGIYEDDYFGGDSVDSNRFTYGWNGLPYQSTGFRTPRLDDTSDLGDPTTADPEWLPWMAQLVGVKLEPGFTEQQARDAVLYASAGWRAGTKQAIADAAKSELTGTKYAAVYDHAITGPGNGGQWDVLIITRPTETPDPAKLLAAVVARGAKPAGVVLRHRAIESSWDTVESENPTWADITETWDELQEAVF